MKAVVYRGVADVALETVPEPRLQKPTDVIIRITSSAICGTDRRYMPEMIELVRSGIIHPEEFLTQKEPIRSAVNAYRSFAQHERGWIKVKLEPASSKSKAA